MAEGAEVFSSHEGFTIRALAMPEYSPHGPGVKFGYVAHVCRPGADTRYADKVVRFAHPVHDFASATAAEEAAFNEGRSIIDGTHASLNAKGL
ncbi:hypothetical protein [Pandoraea sp. PE-S2T-3]|uniref:hypothetical protein n=1 Tax=Pandoraea sp. PE-S2T-3 TaxID=1986993 RepID=UPI001124F6AF|nr:hypothetical protein [Pandoraea sp. PE-S2T-3]